MGACNSLLFEDCVSETDPHFAAKGPSDILGQDGRWGKLTGFFRVDVKSFDPVNGGGEKPSPYNPEVPATARSPYDSGVRSAYYNHTAVGSRLLLNRIYFARPAPEEFCAAVTFPPPFEGYDCGVTGHSEFAGIYAALNHENDGTLSVARATGRYSFPGEVFESDEESLIIITDDNSFEIHVHKKGSFGSFSSVQEIVFFGDDSASAVHTSINGEKISSVEVVTLTRITEDEFLKGIEETNDDFNVPEVLRVESPMTSDVPTGYEDIFPTEADWCGGLISDVACTESPYQEPNPKMKDGFVALFVIIGLAVFGSVAYLLHRNAVKKQQKRYKEQFVRGIARNITIAPSAGMIPADKLKAEFDHIDKNKGGTITKDELKEFMDTGKFGTISEKDFEAMWSAMDVDGSGEVDFVEFTTFLGSCGTEFETVSKEHAYMTNEEKKTWASQRLSVMYTNTKDLEALEDKEGFENEAGPRMT
mmetsp:Transcript_7355/g.10908  ORF Transcript_7355/g.10908 Transcript_7355/m.10908 type:complete len:476 (-) Transcript_7355:613-2040(-)